MKDGKRRNITKATSAALVVLSVLCLAGAAEANTSVSFPWDSALKQLADSLTGPVAFSLGLFMIVCGFCAVAFAGSELGGWVRWVALAAILAGMLGAAPTVLSLFGLQSAMIV
ncbi:MAG: TrbC/VirB2 family protein [Synergistaceae bacterium]|nr:TrbC/VirB2 family protein [Synergistaceae bacterium]